MISVGPINTKVSIYSKREHNLQRENNNYFFRKTCSTLNRLHQSQLGQIRSNPPAHSLAVQYVRFVMKQRLHHPQ